MDTPNALAPTGAIETRRTAAAIREDVNLIQTILRDIMKEGTHYGVIPGTDKPSLWKPGAEQILSTFRIAVDPEVEDLSMLGRDGLIKVHYRVKVRGSDMVTGRNLGAGIGECSSDEEKYRWRGAVNPTEWDATPETRRRLKYKGDAELMQVRANPEDVANTILKMAKKRALIDFTLTATAASDVFTQDLLEDQEPGEDGRPRQAARPKTAPVKPAGGDGIAEGTISDVKRVAGGTNSRGPWIKWGAIVGGKSYAYYDDSKTKAVVEEARELGAPVRITYKRTNYGLDAVSVEILGSAADAEPGSEG